MAQRDSTSVSFDEWRALAAADPEAFEARRREVIAEFIALAPRCRRTRLEQLQWRIDRERERYKDPLAACAHLSGMMWERLYGRGGLLAQIRRLESRWSGESAPEPPRARVIPFPSRRRNRN